VAELRWQWVLESKGVPVVAHDEFVEFFVDWAIAHQDSHRCTIAVRDGVIIGMAWLAIAPRVPSPAALERANGDVQCVYIVKDERDNGFGSRMVAAVLDDARKLGLEKFTVHSSTRAVGVYERLGFASSALLLETSG
jgi:GNAT superfamily N-acetyltransferase